MAGGIDHQAERNVAHGCEHESFEFVIVDLVRVQGFAWQRGDEEDATLVFEPVSEEFDALIGECSGWSHDSELPPADCGYVESGLEQSDLLLERSSRLARISPKVKHSCLCWSEALNCAHVC